MIGPSGGGTLKHENVILGATSPGMMRALDCDNDGEVAPAAQFDPSHSGRCRIVVDRAFFEDASKRTDNDELHGFG
jgi:hypothetical protein